MLDARKVLQSKAHPKLHDRVLSGKIQTLNTKSSQKALDLIKGKPNPYTKSFLQKS